MGLYAICLLTVTIQVAFTSPAVHPDILKEGHAILKRFADAKQKYTSHEVADVLHQKESDLFHRISKRDLRSVAEGDNVKSIRLDLSSGSSLQLNLKKLSLLASDSEFYYNTDRGRVKRQTPPEDCYATGHVEVDGKNGGTVVVALCDGLHGTATSNGVEYYIHPVETVLGEDKVHVLSRPTRQNDIVSETGIDELYDPGEIHSRQKRRVVTADTYKTAKGFTIELAIFVDLQYFQLLKQMVPGREEEFVMMTTAAVQTRYSNRYNIGYKVFFQVKLLMIWYTNIDGYNFQQKIILNLAALYVLTKEEYKYDIHFLLTGVTNYFQRKGTSYGCGMACTDRRMAAMRSTDNSRITIMAREIGHLIGLKMKSRGDTVECPKELQKYGDGFMGRGENFTLCNAWELKHYFSTGKGLCLFEQTAKTVMPDHLPVNVPSVFPGQYQSPDEQCRMFAGEGYEYYNPFDLVGVAECELWMCINLNKTSPHYLRVVRRQALRGFPCGDKDMFCFDSKCRSWWFQDPRWWNYRFMRKFRQPDMAWSNWPQKWSDCSSDCGAGVQVKQRRCQINNDTYFVSPYCRGTPVEAQLCNTSPCSDEKTKEEGIEQIRQARGDEVCARFYNNSVPLELAWEWSTYLPKSIEFNMRSSSFENFRSKSCMLTCERSPHEYNKLDGILPDGTPCWETGLRTGSGIFNRCVQGVCQSLSD